MPQPVSVIKRLSARGRVRYGRFHCIYAKKTNYNINRREAVIGLQLYCSDMCTNGGNNPYGCSRFSLQVGKTERKRQKSFSLTPDLCFPKCQSAQINPLKVIYTVMETERAGVCATAVS